jgi:hypothetical protein
MNVFIDVGHKIIVDNVHNVLDIQATSGDTSGNQDGTLSRTESDECIFTLTLSTITMDRGGRQLEVVKVVVKGISSALVVDENKRTSRRSRAKQVVQSLLLLELINPNDVLGDVVVGGTDTTDLDLNKIIRKEVRSESPNGLLESRREHHDLLVIVLVAVAGLEDPADLRLESHVKHLIGLVDHNELDALERENTATLEEVDETSGSTDKNVTTLAELETLGHGIGTTVDHTRTKHGPVTETTTFIEDLSSQLTGGSDDKNQRFSRVSTLPSEKSVGTRSRQTLGLAHQLGQDGDEESSRLSRTYKHMSEQPCLNVRIYQTNLPVWAQDNRSYPWLMAGIQYR